jgi:hypothetical protein
MKNIFGGVSNWSDGKRSVHHNMNCGGKISEHCTENCKWREKECPSYSILQCKKVATLKLIVSGAKGVSIIKWTVCDGKMSRHYWVNWKIVPITHTHRTGQKSTRKTEKFCNSEQEFVNVFYYKHCCSTGLLAFRDVCYICSYVTVTSCRAVSCNKELCRKCGENVKFITEMKCLP